MMYGQDRYRRRYWVLPHCGGVFIEAMESGEGNYRVSHYNNGSLFDSRRGTDVLCISIAVSCSMRNSVDSFIIFKE